MELKQAQRKTVKLRLNLSGPSGSGKTMSALYMAFGMIGDWKKIAVIDTENGSASLYSHLGDFQTIDLQAPYTSQRYIEAIDMCINAGIECLIIDSSSHEWSGAGGCIESNEKLAQSKYKGNTWSAWNETTPKHDRFVNKILQSPIHIITCTRSKMETIMGEDKKVKKVGMKDVQRDGWEYELTVSLNIERDTHMAVASKDRTELFEGKEPFVITPETGKTIIKWCDTGIVEVIVDHLPEAIEEMENCKTIEALKECWSKWKQYQATPTFVNEKDSTKAKLAGNQPPMNTEEDHALTNAIIEMADCKSLPEGTNVFNKYPKFQNEHLFKKEHAKILNKYKNVA